jgi:hypothetical protein
VISRAIYACSNRHCPEHMREFTWTEGESVRCRTCERTVWYIRSQNHSPATAETSNGILRSLEVVEIHYRAGNEKGAIVGYWDGEVDWAGKLTFWEGGDTPYYLFPNEITRIIRR